MTKSEKKDTVEQQQIKMQLDKQKNTKNDEINEMSNQKTKTKKNSCCGDLFFDLLHTVYKLAERMM